MNQDDRLKARAASARKIRTTNKNPFVLKKSRDSKHALDSDQTSTIASTSTNFSTSNTSTSTSSKNAAVSSKNTVLDSSRKPELPIMSVEDALDFVSKSRKPEHWITLSYNSRRGGQKFSYLRHGTGGFTELRQSLEHDKIIFAISNEILD